MSDIHAGSNVGMLHGDGVQTDEQVWIKPSPVQEWLNEKHAEMVSDVDRLIEGYPRHLFLNGDLTEGVHHKSVQAISQDKGVHIQAAADVLRKGILTLGFESIHAIRGTESHVDPNSGLEKSVMAKIRRDGYPVVKDPSTNSLVWPYVYAEFNDILIDVRHHGRAGQREHTRKAYSALFAQDIWQSHVADGRRPPTIAVRAHLHRYIDSGPDHRGITRAIQMPCWQMRTAFIHRIAAQTLPDIGTVVILIDGDRVHIEPLIYKPDPDKPWRPT
ncbi:MAG: hypothetical protein V3S14_13895 [Anaerolineae bacterium]